MTLATYYVCLLVYSLLLVGDEYDVYLSTWTSVSSILNILWGVDCLPQFAVFLGLLDTRRIACSLKFNFTFRPTTYLLASHC